jgi:hypothetical protein
MEQALEEAVASEIARLLPGVVDVKAECRTRTCLLSWGSDDAVAAQMWSALMLMPPSRHLEHLSAADGRQRVMLVFENPDSLDEADRKRFAEFDASDPAAYADSSPPGAGGSTTSCAREVCRRRPG